ncbi:MAG: glycosyltransferase [Alphaproteobacteria bacterium]|nr:glycosyltransferase [Alphaproteobacteria bacterium]
MRILIINTDYPNFLHAFYGKRPSLRLASYDEQMQERNRCLFGQADFYSHGFRTHGCSAWEVHANNRFMQVAWARENAPHLVQPAQADPVSSSLRERLRRKLFGKRLHDGLLSVLAAQVAHYQPHVILNQDMYLVPGKFLKKVLPRTALVVGQIASPLPDPSRIAGYDLILSSLPNLVARFREMGLRAELCRLAFDPRVLEMAPPNESRKGVVFVGSVSKDHGRRYQLLDYLSRHCPGLQIWGAGAQGLPSGHPICKCHYGEAWGLDMYRLLGQAAIAVNIHIDMAEGHANNCRLYEATGMGALLLTDAQSDLGDIFLAEKEVAAFSSPEECAAKIAFFFENVGQRKASAKAGQARTLSQHTFAHRAAEMIGQFKHYGAGAG